ncbi:MAG: hypothetical protein LH478_04890 [Chitinophagaceae bacterium]|nr:hypothetical protein [Chitinophagaceae bacterium]
MNKKNRTLFYAAATMILFAALTRLFPHYPNFTAIGAIAIFGGSVIKDRKMAYLLPLSALILSDVCLELFTPIKGFYGMGQLFVYGAFLLITWLAGFIRKRSAANVAFAAVWSGLLFFIISNFGVWVLSGTFYPKTFGGLMACYWAAIPFYQGHVTGSFLLNGIVGDLFFTALLFGIYSIIESKVAAQNVQTQKI